MTYAETTRHQAARDLLQAVLDSMEPKTWIKGVLGNIYGQHCLVGWIYASAPGRVRGTRNLALQALALEINGLAAIPTDVLARRMDDVHYLEHYVISFNDYGGTSYPQVRKVLQGAIRRLDVALAGSEAAYLEAKRIVDELMQQDQSTAETEHAELSEVVPV